MSSRSARETLEETVPVGGQQVKITASGVVDLAGRDAELAVNEAEIGTITVRVIPPEISIQEH